MTLYNLGDYKQCSRQSTKRMTSFAESWMTLLPDLRCRTWPWMLLLWYVQHVSFLSTPLPYTLTGYTSAYPERHPCSAGQGIDSLFFCYILLQLLHYCSIFKSNRQVLVRWSSSFVRICTPWNRSKQLLQMDVLGLDRNPCTLTHALYIYMPTYIHTFIHL